MQHSLTHSLAACAAILLTIMSVGAVVTVPPAQALSPSPVTAVA